MGAVGQAMVSSVVWTFKPKRKGFHHALTIKLYTELAIDTVSQYFENFIFGDSAVCCRFLLTLVVLTSLQAR